MGADIVVLRMQGSKFVLEDRFADDWATPMLDAHQDVELLSAVRDASSGRTSFSFKRPLKTCDGGASESRDWLSKMDIDIDPSRPSEIIWAMGAQDTFYQHGSSFTSRGKVTGFMWSGDEGVGFGSLGSQDATNVTGQVDEEGIVVLDMVNDPYNGVPEDGTSLVHTYWSIPSDGNVSYVLVGFERTLGKGIEPYVHHTLLYGCSEPQPDNHLPGPRTEDVCSEILFVIDDLTSGDDDGTSDLKFGVQVGPGTNVQSFRVEVHYDVPVGDVQHSSLDPGTGYYVRLGVDDGTYTPMGTITTGTVALAIPGESPRDSDAAHFWGECVVGPAAGPDGINILYNIFHQHLVGRSMWTTVERKGAEGKMIEIGRQMYYDWNFQGPGGWTPAGTKVYPGDIIRVNCVYDTTGRWNFGKHGGKAVSKDFVTEFGEGTYKEMCFDFLLYYPRKPNFNLCLGRSGGSFSAAAS